MNQLSSYQKLNWHRFGVNLDVDFNKLTKQQFLEVGKIFLNELLVVCRNQTLSSRKFASICYSWGFPQIFNPSDYYEDNSNEKKTIQKIGLNNIPGLVKICNYKDEDDDYLGILSDNELAWHTDCSGVLNPKEVIALYAKEVGLNNHTDFIECVTPYEKLTNEDRKLVDSLHYIHLYNDKSVPEYANSNRTHLQVLYSSEISNEQIKIPLIITSPRGYRGFRYNCKSFIKFVGKNDKESAELKQWIESLLFKEENIYTHFWKPGDLVFMDQTVLLHRRRPQNFDKRLLYRIHFDVSKLLLHNISNR